MVAVVSVYVACYVNVSEKVVPVFVSLMPQIFIKLLQDKLFVAEPHTSETP